MTPESQQNDTEQNTQEILGSYKSILDIAKTSGSYFFIFLAATVLFGAIHLFSFLWFSDLLWLSSSIEYKTILSEGMSISSIFFFAWGFFVLLHTQIKSKTLFKLGVILTIIGMIGIAVYFALEGYHFYINYALIFIASLNFVTFLARFISIRLSIINAKLKINTDSLIVLMISQLLVLLFATFVLGLGKGMAMKQGNYKAYAVHDKQVWGVILNNGGTFIITDTNNTSKIRIIESKDIKYFVQIDELRTQIHQKKTSHKAPIRTKS